MTYQYLKSLLSLFFNGSSIVDGATMMVDITIINNILDL